MMKKFLVFLVMFAFLGMSGVFAVDQTVDATILFDSTLAPTPNPIDFGSLLPGQTSSEIPITLTPGVSDLSVTAGISPAGLFDSIELDLGSGYTPVGSIGSFIVTASTPRIINARLVVPIGQTSGAYTGKIVYLVTEAI